MSREIRTEDDVRAALASLESLAPAPAAVLPRVDRPRSAVSRRTVLLAGAAASVAVAAPFASRLLPHDDTPAVEPAPPHPLEFDYTLEPYGGRDFGGFTRTASRGQGIALRRGGVPAGDVALYRPGFFAEPPRAHGEPVEIGGRPGVFAEVRIDGLPSGDPPVGVLWEPEPGVWAAAYDLGFGEGARAASIRLAESVRLGRNAPLRVPYRLAALPPGLRVIGGAASDTGRDAGPSWVTGVTLRHGERDQVVRIDTGAPVIFEQSTQLQPLPERIGEPTRMGDGVVVVRYEAFVLVINSAPGPNRAQDGLLLDVARAITPAADNADRSTWFAPRDAFPGT